LPAGGLQLSAVFFEVNRRCEGERFDIPQGDSVLTPLVDVAIEFVYYGKLSRSMITVVAQHERVDIHFSVLCGDTQ